MKLFRLILLFIHTITFAQNDSNFKLCGQGKMQPYYYPELKYDDDLLVITSHFINDYNSKKNINLTSNSGIITIQFQVNCKGETGNYTVKMVDFNFKETNINEKIANEILTFTKGLNKWIPTIDEGGEIVNSHKFLTFKIKNSKIIEIYPT
jgi:hypothetical protein